jgi:DNA-binding IclR family transcriptional regulator
MRVAVEAHIPDTLAGHPEGLSITELAEKIGIHSVKLRKIMRALATRHCFRQGA